MKKYENKYGWWVRRDPDSGFITYEKMLKKKIKEYEEAKERISKK